MELLSHQRRRPGHTDYPFSILVRTLVVNKIENPEHRPRVEVELPIGILARDVLRSSQGVPFRTEAPCLADRYLNLDHPFLIRSREYEMAPAKAETGAHPVCSGVDMSGKYC